MEYKFETTEMERTIKALTFLNPLNPTIIM